MRTAITIAALFMLSACNPPSAWFEPPRPAPAYIEIGPPTYAVQTRRVCYDKWGQEITRRVFMARDYRFVYGDHCWEVGVELREKDKRQFR